jgi:uncharacterized protein YdaU (DUF1376 family)/ribosome modulation factor
MSREAYLPLYVGDFLASTAEWTGEEQALYALCLAYQWSIGSLPADPEKVRRLVRWDRRTFARAWPQVRTKFPSSDGVRSQNCRLEVVRAHAMEVSRKRAEAGSKGGKAKKINATAVANATNLPQHNPSPALPSKPNQTNYLSDSQPSVSPVRGGGRGECEGGTVAAGAAPSRPPPMKPAGPGPNRQRRGHLAHFVPEDFVVTEEALEWALAQGYSYEFVERETHRFCDHEFKTPRSDWLKAWRNWITRDPPAGARRHA